jgi:hypothetical protein
MRAVFEKEKRSLNFFRFRSYNSVSLSLCNGLKHFRYESLQLISLDFFISLNISGIVTNDSKSYSLKVHTCKLF